VILLVFAVCSGVSVRMFKMIPFGFVWTKYSLQNDRNKIVLKIKSGIYVEYLLWLRFFLEYLQIMKEKKLY
jgi:hypothetical protein